MVLFDDASRVFMQREDINLFLLGIRELCVVLYVCVQVSNKLSYEAHGEDVCILVLPEPEQYPLLEYCALTSSGSSNNQNLGGGMVGDCFRILVPECRTI